MIEGGSELEEEVESLGAIGEDQEGVNARIEQARECVKKLLKVSYSWLCILYIVLVGLSRLSLPGRAKTTSGHMELTFMVVRVP